MHRFTSILSAAALTVAGIVGLGSPAQAVTSSALCGTTVRTNITLTTDVACPSTAPINVTADATININGRTLTANIVFGVPYPTVDDPADQPMVGHIRNGKYYGALSAENGTRGTIYGVQGTASASALMGGSLSIEWSTFANSTAGSVGSVFSAFDAFSSITVNHSVIKNNTGVVATAQPDNGGSGGVTISNSTIEHNGGLGGCSQSEVSFVNNKITRNGIGISYFECRTSVWQGNTVSYNFGVMRLDVEGITITGNTFSYNGGSVHGPVIDASVYFNSVDITGNTFTANTGRAVQGTFFAGGGANITGNKFLRNGSDGVYILGGTNVISSNTATDNHGWGLYSADYYLNGDLIGSAITTGTGNIASHNLLGQCYGVPCN